jgi:sulfite exporter TauE/SafE
MTAALLAGTLATSVVGSVHCVAMCGPLVGLHGGARTTRLAIVHSLGRLTTYVALGAGAGLAGSAIDLAGRLGNVQRAAMLIAAAVIVALGVMQIASAIGARRRHQRIAGGSPFSAALVHIRSRNAVRRAWLIGILTGLLPCGWLWAFVISAAGTASLHGGALVMLAFWLGTVPAMVGLLRVTGPLLARIRARMPAIAGIALIVVGLGALALRWRDAGTPQVERPHCHCHGDS